MSFTVPNFNITVNIWRAGNVPPAAPDATEPCNLAFGRRVAVYGAPSLPAVEPVMTLLLPPGTDIRGPQCAQPDEVVEVPAGTGRFYTILGVDDVGKGFTNEHRAALLQWNTDFADWPSPIP